MICTILKKSCVDLISNLNFTAMHKLNFVLIANSKDGYCSFSLYSISHLMIHVHLEKSLAAFLEIQVDIQNCIFFYSF